MPHRTDVLINTPACGQTAPMSRVHNKFQQLNSASEKSVESQFQSVSLPLVGWSSENALLMLAKKLQQSNRSIQSQHLKSERPFHHRLIKPCKEFKFYHYDDPRAYIIQYRRDCSSVSTNTASNGPLEMFMNSAKIGSQNADKRSMEKIVQGLGHIEDSSEVFQPMLTDGMVANRDSVIGFSSATHVASISEGPCPNAVVHPVRPSEPDAQETAESSTVAPRAAGTKPQPIALQLTVGRSLQHTRSLTFSDQKKGETVIKASKKTASCLRMQKTRSLEAKLSANLTNSVWIGSNHFWNQPASVLYLGNANITSTSAIRSKANKPGKILAMKRKTNPAIGLRITTQYLRQTQLLSGSEHRGKRKQSQSQDITKAPSVGETERIQANIQSVLTKPHRIRDGSDPAFGKALFERLVKLEQEQCRMDILSQYDLASKKEESAVQLVMAPITAKEVDEIRDLETATNILSVTESQSPN